MVDAGTVVSLVGALGIGSVAGQYLASGSQRRQTRADVLRALTHTEAARWVGPDPRDLPFWQAMRELETACLMARLPREAVKHYKIFASAAFSASSEAWDRSEDPEFGGGIESRFADLVGEAAAELSRLAWSPRIGRFGLGKRIAARDAQGDALEDGEAKWALDRSRKFVRH